MLFSRHIRRREFITLLGGAATWPVAARAQQPVRLPTIGFLGANTAPAQREWTDAFVQRLTELGWIEGHNEGLDIHWGGGDAEPYRGTQGSWAFDLLEIDGQEWQP